MYINKEKLRELMVELTATPKRPQGNYNEFARKLDYDVSRVYKVLTKPNHRGGAVLIGKLKALCEREGKNFDDYIFMS